MADKLEVTIIGKDELSATLKGIQSNMEGLADIAKGALTVGLGAATAAFGAMSAAVAISVKEAMDAEVVQAELEQAIKRTGVVSGITSDMANELAMSLRDLAGGSDDAVKKAEIVLMRFKSIGKDIFPKATETTLDLAAALKMDTASAASLLGKALSTPGEGLMRLKMAGVDFTDQQEKMIKAMVAAGDTAGAQKIIMDALGESVGGSAAAKAKTFSGQMEILRGHLLEVAEGVGTSLMPILNDLINTVIRPALPVIEKLGAGFANFVGSLGGLNGILAALQAAIPTALLAALENLRAAFVDNLPEMKRQGAEFVNWLKEALGILGPQLLEDLTSSINALARIWREHGSEIMAAMSAAFKFIVATVGGALTLVGGIVAAALQLLSGDFEGAWATIGKSIETFWNLALSIVGINLNEFKAMWLKNLEMLGIIVIQGFINILAGIGQFALDFVDMGVKLVKGIEDGIRKGAAGLISAMLKTVGEAIDAAKRLLGIHSPSAVFAEVGRQMMAGMAGGITAAVSVPDVAITRTTNALVGAAAGASGGGSVGGLTFVYAPQMSLGDEREAWERLLPILDRWYEDARRRRV